VLVKFVLTQDAASATEEAEELCSKSRAGRARAKLAQTNNRNSEVQVTNFIVRELEKQ